MTSVIRLGALQYIVAPQKFIFFRVIRVIRVFPIIRVLSILRVFPVFLVKEISVFSLAS